MNTASTTPRAAVRETHIGVVVLVGDRAYKFKKPVNLGFLDLRTREARAACCQREVELNRRLSPDVYLGIARLSDPGETGGEPLVLMRRMPDKRRLSTLVKKKAPLQDTIRQLARIIAAFHLRGQRSVRIDADGSKDALEQRWRASFDQVEPFCGTALDQWTFDEIRDRTLQFLAGRDQLFARRVADHRIVDGHGDLICDDIFCLPDGPRVLDCLEFDDHLRYVDGLDDIAFLAMDLEHYGATELADLLMTMYADFAGDPAPAALRHHYIAYRAFVRVKVACLRFDQGEPGAKLDARTYAELTTKHLRAGAPRMVLIGGLPGAGKSTIAGGIADRLGAVLLASDRIRKEINRLDPLTPVPAAYRERIYDESQTASTYRELLDRAVDLLHNGESVILDASWSAARLRSQAERAAKDTHAQLVQVQCWAPDELRHRRLTTRARGISDADLDISGRMATDADVWPDALRVSTIGSVDACVDDLLHRLAELDRRDYAGPPLEKRE